jgi:hypothetical protein
MNFIQPAADASGRLISRVARAWMPAPGAAGT